MEKIRITYKDIISFITLVIVGSILLFLGMALVGNQAQTYNDIIIETVCQQSTNETGELGVFWIVLLLGVPVLLAINYFVNKNNKTEKENKEIGIVLATEIVTCVANIITYIITGGFNNVLVMVSIIAFVIYLINPEQQKKGIVFTIIFYYFLVACCAIYNNRGGTEVLNSNILLIITILMNIIVLLLEKRKKIINKIILILQVFIPCILILYKCQRYEYNGEILYLNIPTLAKIIIYVLICSGIIFAIYKLIKNWKDANNLELNKIVLFSSCIIIFAVNSVGIDTSLRVPDDLHHSAEEVISYQQIIGKGQEAYVDYSPVSGLFPTLIGAVLEGCGGNITAFQIAHTLFMIIMAMLTMFLMTRHLEKDKCLLLAMLFSFPSYDRIVLVLASLLILLLPKLVKNRNLWLKVWIWVSFIGGLYYPSFGGAVLVGTMPFAVVQIIRFIKSGEVKEKLKTPKFYIGWIICLVPIIICIPLLLNMAKHILLYSSQTKLADGISVFGQTVPDYFMPYLSNLKFIRIGIYYSIRYMIPVLCVWIFVLLLSKMLKKEKLKETIMTEKFLAISSAIITLLISYMSTIVRSDEESIVARATYIIILIAGILYYFILNKYMNKNISSYVILGITAGIALILGYSPFARLDGMFIYSYKMGNEYEIISQEIQDKYPRLGQGFIKTTDKEMFEKCYKKAEALLKYDEKLKFINWGKLAVYYTLDLPTVGQPSLYAAKDFKTHKEIIDAIKEQRAVVGMEVGIGDFGPVLNYYLYNWLLTTNDYVYDDNYKAFLPIELSKKIYGTDTVLNEKTLINVYATDVGRVSSSLGKSKQTLTKIMQKLDITGKEVSSDLNKIDGVEYDYSIKLSDEIKANSADFMYIEFDVDKNIYKTEEDYSGLKQLFTKNNYNDGIYVIVSWGDGYKNQLLSIMGDGKLLIPLGTNVNWLLNNHSDLTIRIKNLDKKIEIKNIEFYNLIKER